jgi:hypothetical protein
MTTSTATPTAQLLHPGTYDPQHFDSETRRLLRATIDFTAAAADLYGKAGATATQQAWALGVLRRPAAGPECFERVWALVEGLSGAYEMQP